MYRPITDKQLRARVKLFGNLLGRVIRRHAGEDVFNAVETLRQGLPECSGVALGVDRLLMSILKLERIDAVLAFDASRA